MKRNKKSKRERQRAKQDKTHIGLRWTLLVGGRPTLIGGDHSWGVPCVSFQNNYLCNKDQKNIKTLISSGMMCFFVTVFVGLNKPWRINNIISPITVNVKGNHIYFRLVPQNSGGGRRCYFPSYYIIGGGTTIIVLPKNWGCYLPMRVLLILSWHYLM